LKRQGIERDDRIVFILNSGDNFIRRAALKRSWVENPVSASQIFDMKWDCFDNQVIPFDNK